MRSVASIGLTIAAPVLALLFGAGCAHSETAADRQLKNLRDGVGTLQAEQDRPGQLAGLDENDERAWTEAPPPPKPTATASTAQSAPPRTIQIGGDADDGASDDPNDPSARPEIRLQGPPGASRSKSSPRTGRGEIRIEPAAPDDGARGDAPRPAVLDPDAKQAYDHARSLVTQKQYDRALEELTAFVTRWPDHPYAENALYWRGEVYFARGEHARAAEQFEAVIARGGNKTPDALLKLGMCQERLGATDKAKETWNRLRRDYARSDAAKKLPSSDESRGRGAGPKESR